jgi:hypothetical protein
MKKSKTLLIASVAALTFGLVSCDPLLAETNNSSTPVVEISDKTYFRNNLQQIYDEYRESSSTVSEIFSNLMTALAEVEIKADNFVSEEKITALCHEAMVQKVKGSSTYAKNSLFQEEKFAKEIMASGYSITPLKDDSGNDLTFNNDYAIPANEDDYEVLFNLIFHYDYSSYIEKEVRPEIVKKLLTAKYLCVNSISSLSRAAAREVQWVKLANLTGHNGDVNKLIQAWLKDKLANSPTSIDLDELQEIYKGTQSYSGYTGATLQTIVEEDLAKIGYAVTGDTVVGNLLPAEQTDSDLESEYTGSYSYPVSWGYTLKTRELAANDFTGQDLYTKSTGISDLPSAITTRLFSSSIASYLTDATDSSGNAVTQFLKPSTTLNGSDFGQYYHYDSSNDAYYIVIVKDYYNSTKVNKLITDNTDAEGNITYTEDLIDIAYDLSSSSTNESQAVLHYLEEYDITTHIHDEYFYNYIYSNYGSLFD